MNNPMFEPRLPYPTRMLSTPAGLIEEYIVPDQEKAEVLKQLYPFEGLPEINEERYDLHAEKLFKIRDFRVTREGDMNLLVSPYYPESGGTVIDWMPAEWAQQE
jgi:hypothetical protein